VCALVEGGALRARIKARTAQPQITEERAEYNLMLTFPREPLSTLAAATVLGHVSRQLLLNHHALDTAEHLFGFRECQADVLRLKRMPLQLRHFLGCYYLASVGFDE